MSLWIEIEEIEMFLKLDDISQRAAFIYFKDKEKLIVWKAAEKSMKQKKLKILEKKKENYRARAHGDNQAKGQVTWSVELVMSMKVLRRRVRSCGNKHSCLRKKVEKEVDPGTKQPGSEAEFSQFLMMLPLNNSFRFSVPPSEKIGLILISPS